MFLTGLAIMLPIMLLVGFLDLAPHAGKSIKWAQCGILLAWFLCYGLTIGPLPYAIATERGASRL
jgi:MFS transporter, SP family, general alpha glucoside:H+ symporter